MGGIYLNKDKLIQECDLLFNRQYDEGGISDWNEFNWFCNEIIPELIPYLSKEGLMIFRQRMKDIRKQGKDDFF